MKYTVCLKIKTEIGTNDMNEIVEKYGENLYWIADEEGNILWLDEEHRPR